MYWYKCWHPYDHIAVIPWPGISSDNPKLPALYIRVWEHYRRLPNETVNEFELNMPSKSSALHHSYLHDLACLHIYKVMEV